MKIVKLTAATGALAVALLLNVPSVSAQEEPPAIPAAAPVTPPTTPPAADASAPGAPRGEFNMEQFRQRMNEKLKASLKVSDEEWAVIQPLLEKVQQAKQRESMMGRLNFPGPRRRNIVQGEREGRPERPASPEVDALKTALDSDATSAADIKAKLEAVRAARKKAVAELEQAREDLRKVLTQRQEATLVMVGILE